MKSLKLIAIILAIIVMAGACKRGPEIPKENVLHMHMKADPESLDPVKSTGSPATWVLINISEGLTRYNPKTLEPLPGVAERWDVSPDGKTYTFYLRKDAKWSDGSPVTAHDFAFAWERMLNPKSAAQYAFALYPIKNAEVYNAGKIKAAKALGFRVVNDLTLEVTLENPTPYFLSLLSFKTFMPVPKKTVTALGNRWVRPENIVCNGPFRLVSWTPNSELILVRNPHYWGRDAVSLEKVFIHPTEDAETAFKKYMAGELDILSVVTPQKVEFIKDHPETIFEPFLSLKFLMVNTSRRPFDDIRVRKALGLALDRVTLVNTLKMGHIPSGNNVPAGIKGYTSPPGIKFDPREAKRLLAEAGFSDANKFPKITIHYATLDENRLTAELIQRMWKENLGINVTILNEEWKVYLNTQDSQNYDVSVANWIGDYADPNTFLDLYLSDSGLNRTGWKDGEFDELIKSASETRDAGKRMKILTSAEAILIDDIPIIPLFQRVNFLMVKPYVRGFYPTLQDLHPLREAGIRR